MCYVTALPNSRTSPVDVGIQTNFGMETSYKGPRTWCGDNTVRHMRHNYDMIWCMIWYMICYMIWYDMWYMIWYDTIWYDMIWYDMIWYDMIWYDMIWYDMIWYDMIWYVIFIYSNWVSTQLQCSVDLYKNRKGTKQKRNSTQNSKKIQYHKIGKIEKKNTKQQTNIKWIL